MKLNLVAGMRGGVALGLVCLLIILTLPSTLVYAADLTTTSVSTTTTTTIKVATVANQSVPSKPFYKVVYRDQRVALFTPSKLEINFARTQKVNVSSSGRLESSRLIQIKDAKVIWNTTDTDFWSINATLTYDQPINQTIVIGYWSEDHLVSSPTFDVNGRFIEIQLQVATSKAPKYPTAMEVATEVVKQIQEHLRMYTHTLDESVRILDVNMRDQWTIVAVGILTSAFAIGVIVVHLLTRGKG